MIVKNSELHNNEWPIELTPQQRDQLLQEKMARLAAWYQHLKTNDHKDCEHS